MTTPAGGGTLGISDDGAFRIQFDRILRHPVPRVWAAITDPERLTAWLPGTRIDPRVGGTVVYDFGDEGTATGEVLAVRAPGGDDPSAELVHTWQWEGVPTSTVRWRLDPVEGGTRLRLVHSELLREPAADFAMGWHLILDTLGHHADGTDADGSDEYYATIAALYGAA